MKYALLLISIILFVQYSCTDRSIVEPIKTLKINPIQRFVKTGDSVYWGGDVFSIGFVDNKFYILDSENSRVIVMNSAGEFISIIGSEGKGPGEMLNALYMTPHRENLYVLDEDNGRLNIYTQKGVFLETISDPVPEPTMSHFEVLDTLLYFSSRNSKELIFQVSSKGNKLKTFGIPYRHLNANDPLSEPRNYRHLVLNSRQELVTVGRTEAVVEVYDKSGKLLRYFDFMNHPVFLPTLKTIEMKRAESKRPDKSIFTLFNRIEIAGDKLYGLMVRYDEKGNAAMDALVIFDMKDNSCKLNWVLDMADISPAAAKRLYSAICIYEDGAKLMAFELTSGEIHVYDLRETLQ